ncbi:hypothetical protein EX30DRAFT_339550 [Ascodesmis nigricans]|uniref:RRM domain-containing protein n=1 Tax=Ascodesmis nigricans TaxID=341454 RepID=A0A4S2N2F8_9PEZI|nr:hypothetical protein EX30DRAFT_339550 [Ascodesmis nigricans]
MSPPTTGRVIFVGNIPYGLTEEQITEIFSSAGRVLSFRLVYDRETGRPKGFGFAEYPDPETAASAVRNLDNYEIMGRKLRVDFSHEGNTPPPDGDNRGPGFGGLAVGQSLDLPRGTELPPGLTAPDAISQTMKAIPVPQLLDILHQMKTLVSTEPAKATQLLREAPQLSYAVFQALLLMNLVDAGVLTQVIETAAQAQAPVAPVVPPPPPPPVVSTTPVQPAQAAQMGAGLQGMDPNQAALIQQVMRLTDEQLAGLAPEQRQQILMLRAQFMGVVG